MNVHSAIVTIAFWRTYSVQPFAASEKGIPTTKLSIHTQKPKKTKLRGKNKTI